MPLRRLRSWPATQARGMKLAYSKATPRRRWRGLVGLILNMKPPSVRRRFEADHESLEELWARGGATLAPESFVRTRCRKRRSLASRKWGKKMDKAGRCGMGEEIYACHARDGVHTSARAHATMRTSMICSFIPHLTVSWRLPIVNELQCARLGPTCVCARANYSRPSLSGRFDCSWSSTSAGSGDGDDERRRS